MNIGLTEVMLILVLYLGITGQLVVNYWSIGTIILVAIFTVLHLIREVVEIKKEIKK